MPLNVPGNTVLPSETLVSRSYNKVTQLNPHLQQVYLFDAVAASFGVHHLKNLKVVIELSKRFLDERAQRLRTRQSMQFISLTFTDQFVSATTLIGQSVKAGV